MLYSVLPENAITFVGIDIAKKSHSAGFISRKLLMKHRRFESCPTFTFKNTREGFVALLKQMERHSSLDNIAVLIERTGHYHRALEEFLLDNNIVVYEIHAHQRMLSSKTDKLDSLALANALYNQIELHVQLHDSLLYAHQVYRHGDEAICLRALMNRRDDLIRERTRRKNRLTSILDETFPEFTQILKDPNGQVALTIRERFETREDIANASLEDLKACRGRGYQPGVAKLVELQQLARTSIGATSRVNSLVLDKRQLIEELRMIEKHIDEIERKINDVLEASRTGMILLSMPAMGTIDAAMIIAAIGNIKNFPSSAKLRGYFGWAPKRTQTGTSKDSTSLNRAAGLRYMKQTMYMLAWRAVDHDSEWKDLYNRLVLDKCVYDMAKKKYRGKNKVIGRVIGQIINMIYSFLKRDAEIIEKYGYDDAPPPVLYDRAIHRTHRLSQRSASTAELRII